jgi:hypothetical protein
MFHRRSSEFEPRISAITEHLRGIQKELGVIGNRAVNGPLLARPPLWIKLRMPSGQSCRKSKVGFAKASTQQPIRRQTWAEKRSRSVPKREARL